MKLAVRISIGLMLSAGLGWADSSVTVGQPLQRIDGFGASDAWYAPEIHSFSPAVASRILDTLFSATTGAGLSLLRHRVPYEIEPSRGVWDWTQDNDSVWLQNQAEMRGLSLAWSTVWSPPAWMKSNNNVNNGGSLLPAHYQDYATYLAQYITQYQKRLGTTISGISIQNEPDINATYESCLWSSQQFHDFVKGYLIPTFQADGIAANVMMPERSGWADDLAAATLADPVTAAFIDVVASHNYWGTVAPFSDALALGKTVWETEVSNLGANDPSINDGLYWAQVIHHTLVDAGANAWHYWWLYSDVNDTTGQSLISGSPGTNTFTVNKRLWTIGNFSRFVRPGAHMLALSSNYPEAGVFVTAFKNLSGAVTYVAINANSYATTLTIDNLATSIKFETAYEYRTSATEDLAFIGQVSDVQGAVSRSLLPMSVTTIVCPGSQVLPPIIF